MYQTEASDRSRSKCEVYSCPRFTIDLRALVRLGFAIAILATRTATAEVLDFPKPNKPVHAIAVANGVVYIGGEFTKVDEEDRNNLAAMDTATGALKPWNPDTHGKTVRAIVASNSTIYVGGDFFEIGSAPNNDRNHVAAVNATTGARLAWDPNANKAVHAIAVSGTTVYVGGYFDRIGAQAQQPVRNTLAALDDQTANATAWDPGIGDGSVRTIDVGPDGTVYVGGYFTKIGTGQTARKCVAALDANGAATPWDPSLTHSLEPDPPFSRHAAVLAMKVVGTEVFVGGNFDGGNGTLTPYLYAASTAGDGSTITWNPRPGPRKRRIFAIAVSATTVYAGGRFTQTGGGRWTDRTYVAAWDNSGGPRDGKLNPPLATLNGEVFALAVSGGKLFIGGKFTVVGRSATEPSYFAVITLDDCNNNGIADDADIASGAPDDNENGIPDECEDFGPCCDNTLSSCTEMFLDDCDEAARFDAHVSICSELSPSCGSEPSGACCDDEAAGSECTPGENPDNCLLRYGGDWSDCATVEPPCGDLPFGACCDTARGFCEDGIPERECSRPGLDWHEDDECYTVACEQVIPTVSQWGMLTMALLVLTCGTLVFMWRRRTVDTRIS